VIFGATGDLALRKLMPALASLAGKRKPAAGFSVVGVSRAPKSDDTFRNEIRTMMPDDLKESFDKLAKRVHYMQGDVSESKDIGSLSVKLDSLPGGRESGRLFYLSLKPELFAPTVGHLSNAGLLHMREGETTAWRRVIVEKPFGHDYESATELNRYLHERIREYQIYRIDHYLGKETVQNLLGFRFHNTIFEPLWNNHHIEQVQITVAEDLGMESGRGGYYDTTGALRDMLQNHMLQVLSLIAMEPPSSLEAAAVRNAKVAVLRGLHVFTPREVAQNTVRARYTSGHIGGRQVPGYLEEEGVAGDSSTETYVAVRSEIDNWRWAGVPFLLCHGKRLAKKSTEVRIQFRSPPIHLFNRPEGISPDDYREKMREGAIPQLRPNVLTLSIQPREAITLSFGVKTPGASMIMTPAELSFDYRDTFGTTTAPAYERLLYDAMLGDPTLFLRGDEIEESWRFADAIQRGWAAPGASPMLEYEAGSWGPAIPDGMKGNLHPENITATRDTFVKLMPHPAFFSPAAQIEATEKWNFLSPEAKKGYQDFHLKTGS
jgi:glucose-6-phosphate 1-dehydrogenase